MLDLCGNVRLVNTWHLTNRVDLDMHLLNVHHHPCAQEHQPILLQWPLTHSTNICCDEVLRSVHLDLPPYYYYLSIYKIGVMMMSYLMYSTLHSHRHKKRELCLPALLTTVHSNVLTLGSTSITKPPPTTEGQSEIYSDCCLVPFFPSSFCVLTQSWCQWKLLTTSVAHSGSFLCLS